MEYDWKRRPSTSADLQFTYDGKSHTHLWFDTVPHETVEDFQHCREQWEAFNSNGLRCLKSVGDLSEWFEFQRIQSSPTKVANRKYLRAKDGGLGRLRRHVAVAYKLGKVGTRGSSDDLVEAATFAEWMNEVGIECSRSNIYSDWERYSDAFKEHQVPRTPNVLKVCQLLEKRFPNLEIEKLLEPE